MMQFEDYRIDKSFIKYNAHPKLKNVGDCVKRSLAVATGIDYLEIARELNKIKRNLNLKEYNQSEVWRAFIDKYGYAFKKHSFPAKGGMKRMDGFGFAESHPKGTFILRMAHHLSVCIDGSIVDTWDCRHKCVYNAFEVIDDVKL